MNTDARWSTRRRWLIALTAACLLVYLVLWSAKSAITQVSSREEMDWNGDHVTRNSEIAQAFYAVAVRTTTQNNRQCREFYWRTTHAQIRIVCQTVIHPPPRSATDTPRDLSDSSP